MDFVNSKDWNLFVDLNSNYSEASARALSLCSTFLGGRWASATAESFKISKVSGGMTNLIFKCTVDDEAVLLRIQCNKDSMQLQNELVIFMALAANNLGPKLLGIFPGGRLEEFVPSRIITEEEMRSPRFSINIARIMARIHHLRVPLPKSSQVVATLREWVNRIRNNGLTELPLSARNVSVPENRHPDKWSLEMFSEEIDKIEQFMSNSKSPCYLSNNDIYAGNVLFRDGYDIEEDGLVVKITSNGRVKTDEDALIIIDFEFGMYNYRGYDIGNHMNELGLRYFEEEPTYEFDLEKQTDEQSRRIFCTSYLKETYKILLQANDLNAAGLTGELEKDLETLLQEVKHFQAISHFFWGVWNIICMQENIVGMNFESGHQDRLVSYYYMKPF